MIATDAQGEPDGTVETRMMGERRHHEHSQVGELGNGFRDGAPTLCSRKHPKEVIMHTIDQMIASTPNQARFDKSALSSCLEACVSCELTCVSCADACLGEEQVDPLRRCIRLNQDCADLCGATARVLSRQLEADFGLLRGVLEACALACAACAAECAKHTQHHEHCRICAEACRKCESECRKLLRAIPQGVS